MGSKARDARRQTRRRIRDTPLSPSEQAKLQSVKYQGNPQHKRNPGDFGLVPPALPHPEKTHCDEAKVFNRAMAEELLAKAVKRALVSEATTASGLPKQIWVVDETTGLVFEGMHGPEGCYHGYPIRRSDPLFDEIVSAW